MHAAQRSQQISCLSCVHYVGSCVLLTFVEIVLYHNIFVFRRLNYSTVQLSFSSSICLKEEEK